MPDDKRAERVAALSPDSKALLVDVMRKRVGAIDAEVTRLEDERDQVMGWLLDNDPDHDPDGFDLGGR